MARPRAPQRHTGLQDRHYHRHSAQLCPAVIPTRKQRPTCELVKSSKKKLSKTPPTSSSTSLLTTTSTSRTICTSRSLRIQDNVVRVDDDNHDHGDWMNSSDRFLPQPREPTPLLLSSSVQHSYPEHPTLKLNQLDSKSNWIETTLTPTTIFPLRPEIFTQLLSQTLPQGSNLQNRLLHPQNTPMMLYEQTKNCIITGSLPNLIDDETKINNKGFVHEAIRLGASKVKGWSLYTDRDLNPGTILVVHPTDSSLGIDTPFAFCNIPDNGGGSDQECDGLVGASPRFVFPPAPLFCNESWLNTSHLIFNLIINSLSASNQSPNQSPKSSFGMNLDTYQTKLMFRLLIERAMGSKSSHYLLLSSFPRDYGHLSSLDQTTPFLAENANLILRGTVINQQKTFKDIITFLNTTSTHSSQRSLSDFISQLPRDDFYMWTKSLPILDRSQSKLNLFQLLYTHLHFNSIPEFIEQLIWAYYSAGSYSLSSNQNEIKTIQGDNIDIDANKDYAKEMPSLQSPPNLMCHQRCDSPLRLFHPTAHDDSAQPITPLINLINTTDLPNCSLITVNSGDLLNSTLDKVNNPIHSELQELLLSHSNSNEPSTTNSTVIVSGNKCLNQGLPKKYRVLIAKHKIVAGEEITIPYFETNNNKLLKIAMPETDQERFETALTLRTTFSISKLFSFGLSRFPPAVAIVQQASQQTQSNQPHKQSLPPHHSTVPISSIEIQSPINGLLPPLLHGYLPAFNWGERVPLQGINMASPRYFSLSYYYLANGFKTHIPPSLHDQLNEQHQLDQVQSGYDAMYVKKQRIEQGRVKSSGDIDNQNVIRNRSSHLKAPLYSFRDGLYDSNSNDGERRSSKAKPRSFQHLPPSILNHSNEPHLNSEPLLSYSDTPPSLRGVIIPTRYPHAPPHYSSKPRFQFLKNILTKAHQDISLGNYGDMMVDQPSPLTVPKPLLNNSPAGLGWDGPTPLLWALCRLYAIGTHYINPPSQDPFLLLNPTNTDTNTITNLTRSQSFELVYSRVEARADQVLDNIEEIVRNKYGHSDGTPYHAIPPSNWLSVLCAPYSESLHPFGEEPFCKDSKVIRATCGVIHDDLLEFGAMVMLYSMITTQVTDLYTISSGHDEQPTRKLLTIPHLIQSLDYTLSSRTLGHMHALRTGTNHNNNSTATHQVAENANNQINKHALALNYLIDYQHAALYSHTMKVLAIRLGLDLYQLPFTDQDNRTHGQLFPMSNNNWNNQLFTAYNLDAIVASSLPSQVAGVLPLPVQQALGLDIHLNNSDITGYTSNFKSPDDCQMSKETDGSGQLCTHNIYSVKSSHFISLDENEFDQ